MESLYFIVNPIAGCSKSLHKFRELEALLQEKGVPYKFVCTTKPLEAAELAKKAVAAGEKYIIAVGGDGTVNEVASSLYNTDAVMGILPFGTGNDLCRSLAIPEDPRAALEILLKRNIKDIDVGLANERFFINVAGLGFDVAVLQATDKHKARFRGMLPYLLALFEVLAHLRSIRIRVKCDNPDISEFETEAVVLLAGNGRFFGGGMQALPQADPFDGSFDVCIIEKISAPGLLRLLPQFIRGRHLKYPIVRYFRAGEIEVECPDTPYIQLDGEVIPQIPVRFRILPGALHLIAAGD